MDNKINEMFPLSKNSKAKGSRRLAREKILQVLFAYDISEINWQDIFLHVFYRKFNFGDNAEKKGNRPLRNEEIIELESDIPIRWKDEEVLFGRELIKRYNENKDLITDLIKKYASNWEYHRIARIDRILMGIAITELLCFEEIPPKVSINEAIDIAKKYSTPKSGLFINGVLDTIRENLEKEHRIKKSGRGLLDK